MDVHTKIYEVLQEHGEPQDVLDEANRILENCNGATFSGRTRRVSAAGVSYLVHLLVNDKLDQAEVARRYECSPKSVRDMYHHIIESDGVKFGVLRG